MTTNHDSDSDDGRDARAAAASRRAAHYERAHKIAMSQGQHGRDAALAVLHMEAYDDDADRMMGTLPYCGGSTVSETTMHRPRCVGRGGGPFSDSSADGHAEDCPRGQAFRVYWERRSSGTRAGL